MKKMCYVWFMLFCMAGQKLLAQMPNDHIYMAKKDICAALIYSHTHWNHYWENGLFRENLNIGRFSMKSMMAMAAYGLGDNSNLITTLPYVQTKASAGNLMGQEGLQDAGLWFKHRQTLLKGLRAHGVLGATFPVSNYVPDFMPMSIGMKTTDLQARVILNYQIPQTKLYANAMVAYHRRGHSRLDRDAYLYHDQLVYLDKAKVPNAIDLGLRLGWAKWDNQIELFWDRFACTSGDNIRRNDMPFLTNKTQSSQIGVYVKYQPKQLGFNARFAQVLSGENSAQTQTYALGLLYQFTLLK